ncbi:MAG: hypothetical protein HQ567_24610 [Candidatus Nealsonbacteria bacterium]|nr:hypothetical protein [Candidatus Nealsonbacteria bacterium]
MTRIIAVLTLTVLVLGLSSVSAQDYPRYYYEDLKFDYAGSPSYSSPVSLETAAGTDVSALGHHDDTNDAGTAKVDPDPKPQSVSESAQATQGGHRAYRLASVARTAEATDEHETKETIAAVEESALQFVAPLVWPVALFFVVVSIAAMFLLWNIASQVSILNQAVGSSDGDMSRYGNRTVSPRRGGRDTGVSNSGGRRAATGTIPEVVVSHEALNAAFAEIRRLARRMPGDEVGCTFVGRVIEEGSSRKILLNGILTEGDNVERSAGHHDMDRQAQQRELAVLQVVDPRVSFMGDLHLHPGNMTNPSGGDHRTDVRNVKESATQELILGIFTHDSGYGGWNSSGKAIHQSDFRLDLYYMGSASNFDYVPIRAYVSDETPMLTASPGLADFVRFDPVRAQLDFAALRRLPDYEEVVFSTFPAEDAARELACVQLLHRRGYKATIVLDANPNLPPSVLVEIGGEVITYEPDFLRDSRLPNVWLAQIAMELEKEFDAITPGSESKMDETPSYTSPTGSSRKSNRRHRRRKESSSRQPAGVIHDELDLSGEAETVPRRS